MDRRAAVVRITTFRSLPGRADELAVAAAGNARTAREAPGCRTAEVCTSADRPDTVLVVSRWESAEAVQDFLDWHERLAHDSVSGCTAERPHSVHYQVADPD